MSFPYRDEYIKYRIEKAYSTFKSANLLAKNKFWNDCINRLYYSAFYAINAILLKENIEIKTHSGLKSAFNQTLIKTGILKKEFGEKTAFTLYNIYQHGISIERGDDSLVLLIPKLMTLIKCSRKEKKSLEKAFERKCLLEFLSEASCILIDTPDYDKRNRREMINDLKALQALWEELNNYSIEEKDGYPPNMVIFFQKELFQGHFFFGKMLVHEKKPLDPRQMADYFEKRFPDHPFTREALEELAALSRGIFRRFKKYIQTCLENYYLSQDISKITVEHVKKWISMDMLIRDMELELLDIFPKRKEQRVMTVKLLRYLHERGGMATQKEITEDLFEGEKMACSRLLRTLESHGYIVRVKKRGEKGYFVYLPDKYQEGGDIKV